MAVNPWRAISPQNRLAKGSLRVIHWTVDWSLALGLWDGNRALLIRWNGVPGPAKGYRGNPLSRTYPTWFVMPDQTILDCIKEPNKTSASDWLDRLDPPAWVDPVPSGWGDY